MRKLAYYEINVFIVIGSCPADTMRCMITDDLHPEIGCYDDIRYTLELEITNEELNETDNNK